MKYVCDVCGWEYEEEAERRNTGSRPAQSGRIFPTISNARCAA